jgi:hypothetical protein
MQPSFVLLALASVASAAAGGTSVTTISAKGVAPQKPALSVLTSVLPKDSKWLDGFFADVRAQTISRPWELVLASFNASIHAQLHDIARTVMEAPGRNGQLTIKLVSYAKDLGLYPTWDNLIEHVVGADVVTNWNVDDRKHPKCLETKLNYLVHADMDVVTSAVSVFMEDGSHVLGSYADSVSHAADNWWTNNGKDTQLSLADVVHVSPVSGLPFEPHNIFHNSPMWRKSVHDIVGRFEADGDVCTADDWELWTRVLRAGLKVWHLSEPLELYSVRASSHNRANPNATKTCEAHALDDLAPLGLMPWGAEYWNDRTRRMRILVSHELVPTLDQGGKDRKLGPPPVFWVGIELVGSFS